jgi:ParB-like chromosome segregation protein Spo0J
MNIFKETNYRLFKSINGNRDVSAKKVKKIIESYKSGINLFPFCPVLVNNQFLIIDGQHRIVACKELGLPVFYIIVPELTLQQIARINSSTDKWKNSDFLNCYIKIGNENYKILNLFKEKFKISISLASTLLMNGSVSDGGGKAMEDFREGKFIVQHQEKAEKLLRKCYDYEELSPEYCHDRSFIIAIEKLLTSELYNHTEVVDKLKRNGSKIEKKSNYKQYIYHLEELFNIKNSTRKILYNTSKSK